MTAGVESAASRREQQLAQSFATGLEYEDEINRFLEPVGGGLHHLFTLRVNGRDWIGRKVLQQTQTRGWHLSSRLKPWMLLGPLIQWHWADDGAALYFRRASAQEKERVFETALMAPDSEICFPCPVMDDMGLEFVCPANYWQCNETLAAQLDGDEAHLREHCAAVLGKLCAPGSVIHDPACSTGEFIAYLAGQLPGRHCLGSDRSPSMIEHAKNRHRHSPVEFFIADAQDANARRVRCDVLILRFLNAEVMTRVEAQEVFRVLITNVTPGGTVIVCGHTPVLLAVRYLAQVLNLQWLSGMAARPGQAELFQFYCLRVPA